MYISNIEKALGNKVLQRGVGHIDLIKYQQYLSEVHYLMGNNEKGDYYKALSDAIIRKTSAEDK
ncbi:MAG: hypothetical protein IPM48_10315 [Saprospiraceae bacterium]|nr:hypothetical protein [Saprospiraceae bacterium]